MRELRVATPSGDLVGSVDGSGPEVLLLHGGPGLSDYLTSLVEELRDGYTVACYTQRGTAPSSTDGDVTVAGHVADVLAVVDHLGWERPLVGGHSWGGHLALHLLCRHPGRWRAALVVDPLGAVGDGGLTQFAATLDQRVPAANRSRLDELNTMEAASGSLPTELALEQLTLVWPAYFPDPATPAPMPEMSMTTRQPEMWASIMTAFPELESRLSGCSVPTVFVHGELSPMPVTASTEAAALMAHAHVDVVPGAGHFVWLDSPGTVRRSVDRLLSDT